MPFDWRAVTDRMNGVVMKTFGENVRVLYMPASGATPYEVDGVFDEAFLELAVVDGVQVATVQPRLGIQVSQFEAAPVQDDQLQIKRTGLIYVVREARLDGWGGGGLMLNLIGGDGG
ncbi:head-tail joining protein [Paraburkholderia xenovorans]